MCGDESPWVRLTTARRPASTGPSRGEADGPRAGLAALAGLDRPAPPHVAAGYLYDRDGDRVTAARLCAEAARSAANLPEGVHLTRQAARLNAQLRGRAAGPAVFRPTSLSRPIGRTFAQASSPPTPYRFRP